MNKIGIYKIVSPSGKVYIGQSTNLQRRLNGYKYYTQGVSQGILNSSLIKYGWENHQYSIVHELPSDISLEILTIYEQFYIDQYSDCGFTLLNINKAATRGPHSEETCKKIGDGHKGRIVSDEQKRKQSLTMTGRQSPFKGKKHTEEVRKIIKEKRALQIRPIGYKRLMPVWNKGKVGVQVGHNKGKHLSEETKAKISKSLTGKKLSPESILKRTATLKMNKLNKK